MKTFCCISRAQIFFVFSLCQVISFFNGCFSGISVGVEKTPTLDLFFLINDMAFDALKNTLERQHVIIGDPEIISFDRCQEVEFRSFGQFPFDLAGWESLIGNDDSFSDVIITDKCRIRTRIDAVTRKDFGTHRFHLFYVMI